jgi:uncharacterized protein
VKSIGAHSGVRWIILISGFFSFSFLFSWLFGISPGWGQQAKPRVAISIASGGTGGVYYVFGGGVASIISKNVPGIAATAEMTGASVDNCKLIMLRKAELGFAISDTAFSAYAGTDRFQSTGKVPLRALAMLYPAVSQIITVEGRGINKPLDLKGKRISMGAPGTGSELTAFKVLEALGLDPVKDIRRERLGASESTGAIKDNKIDAFLWAGGIPTAAVLDLASTPGVKIKLIAHDDLLEKINQKYGPTYFRLVIPKETYPGMPLPVPVVATGNVLLCHEQMDENTAYMIVKAIMEHLDELRLVHKDAEKINLESAVVGSPVPFHQGAIKYYKEKNVLK